MPRANAGEVQDDKQQDQADGVDPDHVHPAWCAGGGGPDAGVGRGEQVSLRHLTLLALLSPAVRGHASGRVHRQGGGREQYQQSSRSVDHELDSQRAEIGTGRG